MLPTGPEIPDFNADPPARLPLAGEFVSLLPLDPVRDAAGLYAISHGDPETELLWTYLPYGPFENELAMRRWLEGLVPPSDPLFFTVYLNETQMPAGMTSFQAIFPAHRRLELAHIWYGPAAQRTKTNTETIYLMLRESFETLGYRRVEWKCDSLNEKSRAAARRLGFRYEGTFRQHVIYKGRSRDTTWFAMMDHEWPEIKENLEGWLYGGGDYRPLSRMK